MADYLVDKNRGSDSNNGISAPKQSISFLASTTLNSGDNVLFAADSVFTDAPTGIGTVAGTKAAPVTFGRYFPTGVNTGRPTFSYLRSMAAGDWTWDAVFNGWYFSPGYSPGESSYIKLGGQHWGYFHFGVSALDGDDYEWALSGAGAGTKLYLWAPESTNPTDYYGSVDFAPSARGQLIFSSDGAYVVIEGLHVEGGSALTLIYSSSGTREYVVRDITAYNCAGILSVNTDTGGALSLTVDRCEGHLSPGAMIFAFPTSGVGIAKFHATNNVFSGAGHAWTQGAIYTKVRNADQLIAWNDISDCPHGAGYGVYDGCGIYAETGSGQVRVIGNILSRMHLGAIDNSGRNAVWSGNVFVDVKSALKLDDEASVGSTDHKFLCNTIIRSGSAEYPSLGIEESGNGWRAVKNLNALVANNLFVAASGASSLYAITTPTSGTGSIANNLAYGFAGLAINSSGGAASPTPTGTGTSNPLLDDSYRPRAGSPCLEAGTRIADVVLKDFYGKDITKTPDIGAVQVYPARAASAARGVITRSASTRTASGRRAAYG